MYWRANGGHIGPGRDVEARATRRGSTIASDREGASADPAQLSGAARRRQRAGGRAECDSFGESRAQTDVGGGAEGRLGTYEEVLGRATGQEGQGLKITCRWLRH